MLQNRIVEYVFFFGLLAVVAYLVWNLLKPFVSALALAAIVVTICYPLYRRIVEYMPGKNETLASFATTLIALAAVIVPTAVLGLLVFREAASIYRLFSAGSPFSLTQRLQDIEAFIQTFVPEFSLNITGYIQQGAALITSNVSTIFTGTASTIFMLFVALIATFYFFRDGKRFTKYLIDISPLPESEETLILRRLARSIRSVALGIVLVALIQGVLTAIGLALFGFDRAILWGAVAAFGALIPGIGTSIVFIPAVLYLVFNGSYFLAVGVAIWATLAVGLIDNLLGPYLMSRGVTIHPFMVLLSVIGGIVFFGPIGFMLGPVIVSLFIVLLEIYGTHIAQAAEDT